MKKLRFFFIFAAGLFFYTMLLGISYRNIFLSKDEGRARLGFLSKPMKSIAEIPLLFKTYFEPPEFYVKNDSVIDGLKVFQAPAVPFTQKMLVSYKTGVYESVVDLIDLNTGHSIKKWAPKNKDIFVQAFNKENPGAPPSEDSDLYYMHPLLMPDSSIVVASQISSLLARIGADNNLIWLKNDRVYHHSMELDREGNIYVCTRPFRSKNYPFLPEDYDVDSKILHEDHITKIDPKTGEILFDKSVLDLLIENGFGDLLLAKGQFISDPTHLNDIQPAMSDTEYWQTGDLLISLRNLSTILLYRPSTNKVLWLKSGPWLTQHDVDFIGDNNILVFGNDVIRDESVIDPQLSSGNLYFSELYKNNNAYMIDMERDSISTPFSRLFKSNSIRTFTSGRCDLLENGDLFIEDTNSGRIIIGDSVVKKMEYVKRIDESHISMLFWSRIIN